MIHPIVRTSVRAWFALLTRGRADAMARGALAEYVRLAAGLTEEQGRQPVRVPVMTGVDPDMRDWSLYMVLEHNAIVNRAMSSVVRTLARGETPDGSFDAKRDVMPSPDPGPEQVANITASVDEHLALVAQLGPLRGRGSWNHPVFGPFDAHRWHCMFGFHLRLHVKQARLVAAGAVS